MGSVNQWIGSLSEIGGIAHAGPGGDGETVGAPAARRCAVGKGPRGDGAWTSLKREAGWGVRSRSRRSNPTMVGRRRTMPSRRRVWGAERAVLRVRGVRKPVPGLRTAVRNERAARAHDRRSLSPSGGALSSKRVGSWGRRRPRCQRSGLRRESPREQRCVTSVVSVDAGVLHCKGAGPDEGSTPVNRELARGEFSKSDTPQYFSALTSEGIVNAHNGTSAVLAQRESGRPC